MSLVNVRQSQIISTYGPGALVDFPDAAVLIAGLDQWRGEAPIIYEPRLLAYLQRLAEQRLEAKPLELRSPPAPEREDERTKGIAAWLFPEWYLAQYEERFKGARSRPLLHRDALVRGRYTSTDPIGKRSRKSWPVVPIRFVQACPNGHVSDIDWPRLIHGGEACGGQLWLDERGTTGDLSELFLRCTCEREPFALVRLEGKSHALGRCAGKLLWHGNMQTEVCIGHDDEAHYNKLLVRHASHAYFPVIERAISIPDHGERLRKAVDAVWKDHLEYAETIADVKKERKRQRVNEALEGFTDNEIWDDCARRRSTDVVPQRNLKEVELDTFLSVPHELGEDKPEGDFYARRLALTASPTSTRAGFDKVVLVHRLREVVVQTGFTRFEPPTRSVESEVDLNVRVAQLGQNVRWLPAIENRGEGVFVSLDPERVQKWTDREEVKIRAREFNAAIQGASRSAVHEIPRDTIEQIYMPYIMLHSLSHLLLTAISLECGYSAASIRERIYVRRGAYGILLYTGTPDAEGTLGGLVQVGRKIERHLELALEMGRLCSNDPVCAQHRPNHKHEARGLHGAACHGCLLIAEPSCERRSEFLDRSLVVPTVDREDLAFFGDNE